MLWCVPMGSFSEKRVQSIGLTPLWLFGLQGIRFPLANVAMAVWGVLWSFRLFFLAEICLLVAFVLMVTVYIGLLMHPASKSRPLDYLCIHTMCRMFLIILFVVDIWQGGLLGLSWYKYLGEHDDPRDRKGKWSVHIVLLKHYRVF